MNIFRIVALAILIAFCTNAMSEGLKNNLDSLKLGQVDKSKNSQPLLYQKKIDKKKYFLQSLLLPGLGEYQLGEKTQAYIFFSAEAFLIGSALALNKYSDLLTDDYQEFAMRHAGVASKSRNERYWVNIGNYDDVDAYNRQKNIKHQFSSRYENPAYFWYWDNSSNRKKYDKLRINAENMNTYSYYAVGAVILNHVISAINSSYLASNLKMKANLTARKKELKISVDL